MSLKWTGNRSESGILRKSEFKEKKEELFVFGYSCKLFRDNEKALHIDQGKHLIPWMGDETLKIDRYDARGALHDLSSLEAPSGGFDWRVELTKGEWDVEQLCDEERYRALHTDEDEEEMYKEEELKRLHAAGYGQVGFNYDMPQEAAAAAPSTEVDEPFVPSPGFKELFSSDIVMPDSQKQNAIIEKTAKFIASQGAQMEILIKAKQGDNPQFVFLNKDSTLHPYYAALTALVKAGKWPEKVEAVEEKPPPEPEEYLHPSLASTVIESAPSIPSIHYKPSADCDYTMLVTKLRGGPPEEGPALAPGEEPPPGTEPLPPRPAAEISRPPVMYHKGEAPPDQATAAQVAQYQQYASYYQMYVAPPAPAPAPPAQPAAKVSTGLSLMKHYDTDSDTGDSDSEDSTSPEIKPPPVPTPPEDVQIVIDKMAAYVARNGDDFAEIVRAKNDPRFTFLEPNHVYHQYYMRLMQQKRGVDVNGSGEKKPTVPVSFSIKKMKEPDPILPKPALPYESSSDEESENKEKAEEPKEKPQNTAPIIPPVVVYKIEQPPEVIKEAAKPFIAPMPELKERLKEMKAKEEITREKIAPSVPERKIEKERKSVEKERKSPTPEKRKEEIRVEKRIHQERKRERETDERERDAKRRERNVDIEKRKEMKERDRYRDGDREKRERTKQKLAKVHRQEADIRPEKETRQEREIKDDLESDIISLVDNPEDLIDLTGDITDTKGPSAHEETTEAGRALQVSRRKRAAEFLKRVGVDPAAASLPASSLASAMVDTLESLRKKKVEEEEKRKKREKRRHREKYDYENGGSHRKSKRRKYKSSDDNDEPDIDGIKKRKRKKEKKHSTKSKKRRRREEELEEEVDIPLNIDLTSTLKELRNSSPTKELVQEMNEDDSTQQSFARESSVEEEREVKERKKKKEEREYSEGEWSSDSEQDSASSASKADE